MQFRLKNLIIWVLNLVAVSCVYAETIPPGNQVINGGFEESASQLTSWRFFNVGSGSASASVVTDANSGRGAALLTMTSTDGMTDAGLDTWDSRISVQGGTIYQVSFASKKVSSLDAHIVCDVSQFHADATQSSSSAFNLEPSSDGYSTFARRLRAAPDTVCISIGFRIKNSDDVLSIGSYLIDDVKIDTAADTTTGRTKRMGWDASSDWDVSAADHLSVSAIDESQVWNQRIRLSNTWSIGTDIRINDLDKGIGTAEIICVDINKNPILKVNIERHITGISQISVDTPGRQLLNSRAIPGGDSFYNVVISRAGDAAKISIYGNKGLIYREETPRMSAQSLDSIVMLGLGSKSSGIEFSNIAVTSPMPVTGRFAALAESAINNLMKNYWVGGPDDGSIVSTYNGYPRAERSPMPKGALWERGMLIFAMDSYYQATGDPLIKRRLAAEWNRMKRVYTKDELETTGNIVHPACDDSGWDSMMYMVFYRIFNDTKALESAKGLVNSAFARWLDDDFGGGMKYDNRKMKSVYQVGVLNCAIQLWQTTGDRSFYDRALGCYNWIESHLLRPDGLYWCDYGINGPELKDRPNDIFEGGSVSFFGGNMGMAVLHARLYRITGDRKYLERAIRTAEAIYKKEQKDGIYLNDRDAWSNGTFAGMWANEVLSLPGMDPKHARRLMKTADSIYTKAKTPDGYYGGCWGGPADGPNSRWGVQGFRPQQIMTSASTANMIMGAALLEKNKANVK